MNLESRVRKLEGPTGSVLESLTDDELESALVIIRKQIEAVEAEQSTAPYDIEMLALFGESRLRAFLAEMGA